MIDEGQQHKQNASIEDKLAVAFIKDFYTSFILANLGFPIDEEGLASKYFSSLRYVAFR